MNLRRLSPTSPTFRVTIPFSVRLYPTRAGEEVELELELEVELEIEPKPLTSRTGSPIAPRPKPNAGAPNNRRLRVHTK